MGWVGWVGASHGSGVGTLCNREDCPAEGLQGRRLWECGSGHGVLQPRVPGTELGVGLGLRKGPRNGMRSVPGMPKIEGAVSPKEEVA